MKKALTVIIALVATVFSGRLASAWEPLGYPYSTWGQIGDTFGSRIGLNGVLIDGYLEQGVDWTKIPGTNIVLNNFIGLRFSHNSYNDPYGNRIGPWFGGKAKLNVDPFGNGYGQLALGIRGEYDYREAAPKTDLRGVVFLQWSFGGDWIRRRR